MSSAAVTVPGQYVAELRRTLLSFYGSAAEELFRLADDYLKEREPLEVLLEQRRHLGALDALIATIGWDENQPPRRDVELRGDRQLLATVLYGVLLEIGERVPEACRAYWLGQTEPAEVTKAVYGVLSLLPLAATVRPPKPEAPSIASPTG